VHSRTRSRSVHSLYALFVHARFGTRKTGRAMRFPECATSRDVADDAAGKRRATNPLGNITSPAIVLSPVLAVVALAAAKLAATRFSIA